MALALGVVGAIGLGALFFSILKPDTPAWVGFGLGAIPAFCGGGLLALLLNRLFN